ncbi:hypothetical protein GCM10009081_10710 [Brevundimonas nasdae]
MVGVVRRMLALSPSVVGFSVTDCACADIGAASGAAPIRAAVAKVQASLVLKLMISLRRSSVSTGCFSQHTPIGE